MIKFKYAIHRVTGIKVRYDEWLELHKNDKVLRFIEDGISKETESYVYKAEDILFSDDFEFVYQSDLEMNWVIDVHKMNEYLSKYNK